MSLIKRIQEDQLRARKAKHSAEADLLTTLLSEAQAPGFNDRKRESTDDEVVTVVKSFIKNIELTLKALAEKETRAIRTIEVVKLTTEREILQRYLPHQFSRSELREVLSLAMHQYAYSSKAEFMKYLKSTFHGKYASEIAVSIIDELLGKDNGNS
jgi:uncharacterized protein